MPRIPLPRPETMTGEQRRVYEEILAGPRTRVVGILAAALHEPELADAWQKLGAFLRYKTSLPPRLRELAVLVTARRWNSQVEWHVHAEAGRKAGLPERIIAAIQVAEPPEFDDTDDALVYEFARVLHATGQVPLDLYDRALARFDAVGVVELTALIGYYTMASMTLNAHEIPMPDGLADPLKPVDGSGGRQFVSLTEVPPAASAVTKA